MTGTAAGIAEPVGIQHASCASGLLPHAAAPWSTASMPPGLAATQRLRLITLLLPLLPGPEDARLSTSDLARKIGLTSLQRERLLLPCLTRLAASGLLDGTRRGQYFWRATPLLPQLLDALRTAGSATAQQLAKQLNIPAGTLGVALGALAWCQLTEYTDTGTQNRYWRCRDIATPITVVTLNASSQPDSRTRQLADCTLVALTSAGAFQTDDHHVLELRELERPRSARAWLHRMVRIAVRADLLIVATPTRLGTFPGLLKHFLDQLGPDAFTRTVAAIAVVDDTNIVPCPTAAALTGVLDHLGAQLPAAPLILRAPTSPDEAAADWVADNNDSLRRALIDHATSAQCNPARPLATTSPARGPNATARLA
jgi:NAD(P)H-dependent FMN reductase